MLNNQDKTADDLATQNTNLFLYLSKGNRISGLEALELFGVMRLPARMWDLRRMGHDIQDSWVHTSGGKRVKQYWLEGK
jgi:hypothetical protein